MTLPGFRYHPDPIRSGSIVASPGICVCCGRPRGYLSDAPVYAEAALEGGLCPWCIADGSAHRKFGATFVDSEAFADGTPDAAIAEITQRTPGYSAWQSEHWPSCCGDATAFLMPAGITELRAHFPAWEVSVLNHIIYDMGISGGASSRLLGSLDRNAGPTVYLFRCLGCEEPHFHIDQP